MHGATGFSEFIRIPAKVIDEIFRASAGFEDTFVLHILSINDYAFSAYRACAIDDVADEDESTEEHAD